VKLAELPNRRVEAWKYSDLRSAVGGEFAPVAPAPPSAPPASKLFAALKPIEIVFERGRIAHWPSAGVRRAPKVTSKADPGAPRRAVTIPMGQWAATDSPDEWMPIIEAGKETRPVHLRIIGSAAPTTAQARIGIVVPENCRLDLIETYEGESVGLTNVLIEAFVGSGGKLSRTVLQDVGQDAIQVSTAQINLGSEGAYSQFVLAEGAKLARIETHVFIEGEGAKVELNGVYMAGAGRHADLTSIIEHKAGGGTTRQLIKGVARKGGRGVFQGKIVVAPHAQKTDARQYHHGILLEEGAEIFAKPELMIHADDVQCAHGNTAGGLDERALFYMRARGLPEAQARAMLIEAFVVEAIPESLDAVIRDELTGRIASWLREARV
jgi:Fe-S cluster assembly protein SufD